MKRIATILMASLLLPATLLAGGIVTNSNQSASFIRMPSRDASFGLDAAYYNPAGLALLKDGFYISVNNQTIMQTRTIGSTYTMNRQEFIGKVSAPLFPSVYAIFKKDKVAYSIGIMPIGGGGTAGFDTGLPSFEQKFAVLPGLVSSFGIPTTLYSVNTTFDGSSLNWGFQMNASYSLSDMISISIGARIVTAKNTYTGALKDVKFNPAHPLINPTTAMISAPVFFTTIGQPTYAAMTADAELDATQSGIGITPIVGINLKLMDNLNVALKYEHLTSITMTNETTKDILGMYPDGAKTPNDMPAMISVGAAYKPMAKLNISAGYHLYHDKGANYGKKMITPPATVSAFVTNGKVIDKNLWEAAFGAEYEINDKILVSAGFLMTKTGVNSDFQSDLSHSLSTNSIGLGGRYMIMENLGVNVGFMKTMYESYTKIFTTYEETYKRDNMTFAIGFDYNF